MAKTIFHSWQADTPTKVGRNFLNEVLEEVCRSIASDTNVDEAIRDVDLDSDTKGVAGQPPIVDTIFKKIDNSSVFIADMTFVGTRLDGRASPNPNVLIEYGWALKGMGHQRTISVMNIAYGKPTRETLPFDLSHLRWPIQYDLPENATAEVKAKEKKKLITVFNEAIRLSLATISSEPVVAQPEFSAAEAKDGNARFRSKGEALGFYDGFQDDANKEIFLSDGSTMWLRIMPLVPLEKPLIVHELKEYVIKNLSNLMPIINGAGGYSWLRAEDGIGVYRGGGSENKEQKSIHVDSIAFAFETGEIWSIDTAYLTYMKDSIPFLEGYFVESFKKYKLFLQGLGINAPYKWIAGVTGVKGRHLQYPIQSGYGRVGDGPICATDTIQVEGKFEDKQSVEESLLPFFKKIFEKCGLARPEYLSK